MDNALAERALMPIPTKRLNVPLLLLEVHREVAPRGFGFCGPAYGDGSGKPRHADLLRCGWGVNEISNPTTPT